MSQQEIVVLQQTVSGVRSCAELLPATGTNIQHHPTDLYPNISKPMKGCSVLSSLLQALNLLSLDIYIYIYIYTDVFVNMFQNYWEDYSDHSVHPHRTIRIHDVIQYDV